MGDQGIINGKGDYHRRILLTGGAGFIGSHVVRALVTHPKLKYYVVCFDKLEYCSSLANLQSVENFENYKFVLGDICERERVIKTLQDENIDTIMHFAAQSHVDNSFQNDEPFKRTNIQGTEEMLEAARSCNIKLFLHVSTDEVYGGESLVALTEDADLQPMNPYSSSKAEGDIMARSYWNRFKLPVIVTRGNNVYGPNQFPEKVIPKFICLLQRGRKCCIHGDGSPTRNFMYVGDATNAYLTVLERGSPGEVYNIGTDFRISVKELSGTLIKRICGVTSEAEINSFIDWVDDRPHNDKDYPIDSSKLRSLGWRPLMDWDQGIDITIEWYRNNFDNWDRARDALVPFPHLDQPQC